MTLVGPEPIVIRGVIIIPRVVIYNLMFYPFAGIIPYY